MGGRYDVRGRAERGGMALEGEGVSSLKKVVQIALNTTTELIVYIFPCFICFY